MDQLYDLGCCTFHGMGMVSSGNEWGFKYYGVLHELLDLLYGIRELCVRFSNYIVDFSGK